MKPTQETYDTFQSSYDFFNDRLFGGQLPQCLIVLHRKKGAAGYFHGKQFMERGGDGVVDEISINPEHLRDVDREIMQTLVHEMAHLWQSHFGKPSRNGYHNKEWAGKMEAIGLIPSSTGAEGGKKTGQRMSDYPDPDGVFLRAFEEWKSRHTLKWAARAKPESPSGGGGTDTSKVKFSCPACGLNAWAKQSAKLICGECVIGMI